MTVRPLGFDFPCMSDLSRRPPMAVSRAEILAEAEVELGRRRRAYPRLVEQARMGQAEADRHRSIWAMIVEELRCSPGLRGDMTPADHAVALARLVKAQWRWPDKVREIRRELALRRNLTPGEIKACRIGEDAARKRLEALDALHWLYWFELAPLDWAADWVGVTAADARLICHGLRAQRELWLIEGVPAGDPAACAYVERLPGNAVARLVAEEAYLEEDVAELARLRPDWIVARVEQAA